MRKTLLAVAIALALAPSASPRPARAESELVAGQITKIDEAAGKITLKHGPMKKLGMDEGMTMVYRVKDPAALKKVKVGDKVKFDADEIEGALTITRIERTGR
jgi:Cu(I)/Ag(I) efflux system protein CusF